METYITQLVTDINAATLEQWNCNPPHFYQAGMRDAMHQPPVGYVAKKTSKSKEIPDDFEASIAELEKSLEGKASVTMLDHFGFIAEQFPPAEKLSEAQAQLVVEALTRLWVAFNFLPTLPTKAPAIVFYPHMVERMTQPAMLMKHGVTGIEFCDYDPDECPFGREWCDCTNF